MSSSDKTTVQFHSKRGSLGGENKKKNGMRSKINGAKKIFARRHTQSFVRTLLSKRTLYDETNGKAIADVTSVPRPFVLWVRIVLRMRGKKERENENVKGVECPQQED